MQQKANIALLKIVEYDAHDFSEEALEAAKNELQSREISESQLYGLREQIEQKSFIQEIQESVVHKVQSKDQEIKSELGDTERKFWYLYLTLVAVLSLFPLIAILLEAFSYGISILSIPSMIEFVLFTFILERCIQKKKIGWIWLQYILACTILFNLVNLGFSLKYYFEFVYDRNDELSLFMNRFEFFDPLGNIAFAFTAIFYYGLLLWIQSKDRIRAMYDISNYSYNTHLKKSFLVGIGISVLITTLYSL
ncbi:hypothetical protein N9B82_04950 [Saprospiraceae bacterium]|nr:hypothetical protein [Saprospiraceae bacterium]